MRIEVHSTPRLNDNGRTGLLLFLASPIAAAIFYAWYSWAAADALRYSWRRDDIWIPLILLGFAGLSQLVGFALLLIGRDYRHDVKILKED